MELKGQDIRRFHSQFYNEKTKPLQDAFILKYIQHTKIKRRRPSTATNRIQDIRCKYFVPTRTKSLIPVCLNTFMSILKVSRFRINNIVRKFIDTGQMPQERRGGDRVRNKNQAKMRSVQQFLNSLKCSESHYCANKSGRKYLPAELNIRKLWTMYNNQQEEVPYVKESYFRTIFNTKYNLGFGSPRVDVCSTCLQYSEKIKRAGEETLKNTLIAECKIHKARAKAFYGLLKDNSDGLLILSFDCQKNLPLPKIPDQATYYSKQIYLYNFTVVKGHSKATLSPGNVTSYLWLENQFQKGSNEIASCIYDTLLNLDLDGYHTLRLVCDGCGGQNKNTILLTMLAHWLHGTCNHSVKKIEVIFPVTGHSFLPADRVFGNIEKKIRKKEEIVLPSEYEQIIAEHSTIKTLGRDCINYDWKAVRDVTVKPTTKWHFGIKTIKRVF